MDYMLRFEAHPQDISLIHIKIFQNPRIFQTHNNRGPKGDSAHSYYGYMLAEMKTTFPRLPCSRGTM